MARINNTVEDYRKTCFKKFNNEKSDEEIKIRTELFWNLTELIWRPFVNSIHDQLQEDKYIF